jgi:hypothetical protein
MSYKQSETFSSFTAREPIQILGKGVTSGVVVTGDDVYDTWEQFIWLVYIGWVYLLKLKKELKLFLSVRPSIALVSCFLSKYSVSCQWVVVIVHFSSWKKV